MGQLTIPNGATVYADTSVFIYTIEEHPSYYNLLQPLWSQFQTEQLELVSCNGSIGRLYFSRVTHSCVGGITTELDRVGLARLNLTKSLLLTLSLCSLCLGWFILYYNLVGDAHPTD